MERDTPMRKKTTKKTKLLCFLLAAVMMCTAGYALPGLSLNASAAGTPTSLGLSEHGIKAYNDGWKYQSGGKGEKGTGGVRVSDCAGLIYAYFSDVGAVGNCGGGATTQVTANCVFSNDISEGLPRIHGLVLTMPDYNDPGTGIYGHIGIYIGNNYAADNSDYEYNMRREPVVGSGRGWTAWHVFDNGLKYPVSGWYAMDGKMYHYTDYEYDVDTTADGYTIGSDGVAVGADGKPLPVDSAMLSSEYAGASTVVSHLKSLGYSGKDSTHDLIYGNGGPSGGGDDLTFNGAVTADGVRVRASASTKSAVVTTLSKGSRVQIVEEVDGEKLTNGGKTSSDWFAVTTPAGHHGYIWGPYVERTSHSGALTAPVIASEGGYVTMSTEAEDADIYYTIDGTLPDETSSPYTGPLYLVGYTYKAVAVKEGKKSPVSTASVLSDGSVFTDLTSEDWFFSAVDQAVGYGIFQGTGDNKFSAGSNVTRAQFVRALANLDGVDLEQYGNGSGFKDVKDGKWYTQAVAWAVETGVVKGYSDNTFHPDELISREQMCQILANYASLEPAQDSAPFADDSRISGWAKDAVYACRDNGLIKGTGGNKFDPKGTATRAQACVITVNYYNL